MPRINRGSPGYVLPFTLWIPCTSSVPWIPQDSHSTYLISDTSSLAFLPTFLHMTAKGKPGSVLLLVGVGGTLLLE